MSVSRTKKEAGQAMTEYIFLILLVSVVSIPVFKLLPKAVAGYVRPIYYCVSRPFP
jgi:Flp pilus assembly pilin Flp